ncbi:MAG: DNA repair protein RadC [Lewinellaceae bacterium]|nr:DNA repair protein RadC [Saprospiraceae bacterium]MCB9337939.1 DNA repair protein RadC [Lewinellaceae bacterium]
MENYPPTNKLPITAWAEDDRPREKLSNKGRQTLTDAELLAILLGSGSRNESAVSLAQRIMESVQNNLNELGKRSLSELMKFKGVGEAKAITIAAALELGRRRQFSTMLERPVIKSSRDAYEIIAPRLTDMAHEEFWMLLLNKGNKVLGQEKISTGGTDATVVDSKVVFRKAIEGQAINLILCHNHPSGTLRPSPADLDLTKKLKQAGEIIGIQVLDHLIVTDAGYFSFADEGIL